MISITAFYINESARIISEQLKAHSPENYYFHFMDTLSAGFAAVTPTMNNVKKLHAPYLKELKE